MDSQEELAPSRTQRKRQALDLQKTAKRLVELDPGDLQKVPLPIEMSDAIELYKRIRSHEARRRQLQFLGKLMRRLDVAPIEDALERIDGDSAAARYDFHQLELWRERLIDDPESLTEYLNQHPDADRQQLRHQLAKVRKAKNEPQRKAESRALFQLLRTFEAADPSEG